MAESNETCKILFPNSTSLIFLRVFETFLHNKRSALCTNIAYLLALKLKLHYFSELYQKVIYHQVISTLSSKEGDLLDHIYTIL
jgi:hypothetical protein